jgi:hypothetical protein
MLDIEYRRERGEKSVAAKDIEEGVRASGKD